MQSLQQQQGYYRHLQIYEAPALVERHFESQITELNARFCLKFFGTIISVASLNDLSNLPPRS